MNLYDLYVGIIDNIKDNKNVNTTMYSNVFLAASFFNSEYFFKSVIEYHIFF